jgi:hypothetical protein
MPNARTQSTRAVEASTEATALEQVTPEATTDAAVSADVITEATTAATAAEATEATTEATEADVVEASVFPLAAPEATGNAGYDAMQTQMVADVNAIHDAAVELNAVVAAWQMRRDAAVALSPIVLPATAVSQNVKLTTWDAAVEAAATFAPNLDVAAWVTMSKEVLTALSTSAPSYDTLATNLMATQMRDHVGNRYARLSMGEAIASAADTALLEWIAADTAYNAAVSSTTAPLPPKGSGGGGGKGSGRGPGKWLMEHGWFFDATCHHCGNHVTGGASPDSFLDQLANHIPPCRYGNLPKEQRPARPYETDTRPEFAQMWREYNAAVAALIKGAAEASGAAFTIRRNVVGQAA